MLIVFVVFHDAHPVARVPLHQHRQLPRCRVLMEDLPPRARAKFSPVRLSAIDVDDGIWILCRCHCRRPPAPWMEPRAVRVVFDVMSGTARMSTTFWR